MPRRAEFDVFTFRPWLGWLTVYEELDDGADFLVRLDGSNIVALFGEEWTGHRISELDPRSVTPVLEVLRRTVREREPIVDQFYIPAVKDFPTFHRVTLPVWEDRRDVWQVIQGMHLAPGLEGTGLLPARGRADQLWCHHPAGTSDVTILQDRNRLLAIMKDGVFHKAPEALATREHAWKPIRAFV